jgi:tetratricopeptide (TPR) repeat protein
MVHPILRRITLGFPAAVVALGAITLLGVNPRGAQDKFRSVYRAEAGQAFAAGDLAEARVRFRRLAADAGYSSDDVFGLATVLEADGRRDEAETLFDRLAPENTTGHPLAHFRRAARLVANGQSTERAIRHLLRAVHGRPDLAEAHALLGQLKLNAGDREAAARHLSVAIRSHPELSLALAEAFTGRDVESAARWASAAVDYFGPPARFQPGDAGAQWSYARALYLAGRFRESADVIQRSLVIANDVPLRKLAAEVYADWCTSLSSDQAASERVKRIEEGLAINPGSGPLVQALVATAAGTGPAALAARLSADHRMATGGPDAVAMRLALGIEAVRRGNLGEGRRLIGDAYRDDPASLVAANNLAWLLIQEPGADPGRAMEIVDGAIKSHPNEPNLRDTRGQISVRMGRWRDAIGDLEFALPRVLPNKDTHRALAKAYRGLNMTSLADAQDQKADELSR